MRAARIRTAADTSITPAISPGWVIPSFLPRQSRQPDNRHAGLHSAPSVAGAGAGALVPAGSDGELVTLPPVLHTILSSSAPSGAGALGVSVAVSCTSVGAGSS